MNLALNKLLSSFDVRGTDIGPILHELSYSFPSLDPPDDEEDTEAEGEEVEEVVAGAALGQSQHLADGVGEEAAGAVKAVVRLTQQAVVLADLGETRGCWTTQTRRSFPIVAVTGGVFFSILMATPSFSPVQYLLVTPNRMTHVKE